MSQTHELVKTTGQVRLIGINDAVSVNQYSASTPITFDLALVGKGFFIRGIRLSAGESGAGAIIKSTGDLLFLTADPAVAAGDTAITQAEWDTVVARATIAAANWGSGDANGADAQLSVEVPVSGDWADSGTGAGRRLWVVLFKTDAAAVNDVAGDDEFLDIEILYQ